MRDEAVLVIVARVTFNLCPSHSLFSPRLPATRALLIFQFTTEEHDQKKKSSANSSKTISSGQLFKIMPQARWLDNDLACFSFNKVKKRIQRTEQKERVTTRERVSVSVNIL